ncbi:hypothetical protein AB0C22_03580 [Micromonospora sp. NPDC048894]|uniref:hypothetical protein n=1 Tax=unclassified Micromonospora TaxID=2617518 RepID=UPI0033D435C4
MGNFKGDPRTLMERYFDAHLHLANWGTRQLMLRLPKHVLDPATVAQYCQGDSASAWTAGKHVIIDLHDEDEDGTDEWDLDGHGPLASIIPVRAGLAAGDPRRLAPGRRTHRHEESPRVRHRRATPHRPARSRRRRRRQRVVPTTTGRATVGARKPGLLERLNLAALDT